MAEEFKLDSREFQRALKEYYRQTEKDLSYVVNRAALNVAIKAAQNTPPAERSSITNLPQKEWWPRFISKRMSKRGKFTRKQARAYSRKVIRARVAATAWLKAGWIPALKTLRALKLGGSIGSALRGTGRIKSPRGDVRPAREGFNPTCLLTNASARDANALQRIRQGLQTALHLAAADMFKYLRERGQQTANKFSGKR